MHAACPTTLLCVNKLNNLSLLKVEGAHTAPRACDTVGREKGGGEGGGGRGGGGGGGGVVCDMSGNRMCSAKLRVSILLPPLQQRQQPPSSDTCLHARRHTKTPSCDPSHAATPLPANPQVPSHTHSPLRPSSLPTRANTRRHRRTSPRAPGTLKQPSSTVSAPTGE